MKFSFFDVLRALGSANGTKADGAEGAAAPNTADENKPRENFETDGGNGEGDGNANVLAEVIARHEAISGRIKRRK